MFNSNNSSVCLVAYSPGGISYEREPHMPDWVCIIMFIMQLYDIL